MKRVILMTICALFSFSLSYAQEAKAKSNKETVTFKVEEMNCENCVKKVEKNIAFEKGVTDLKFDLKSHTVQVSYRPDKTNETALADAFQKLDMGKVTKEAPANPKQK